MHTFSRVTAVLPVLLAAGAVAGLFLLASAGTADAQSAQARRTLSSPWVEPGGQVRVTITARDFGAFAQIDETLPPGFRYAGSDLPAEAVTRAGQKLTVILLGESKVTYTLAAPDQPGSYAFSGVLLDARRVEHAVGGSGSIRVGPPPTPRPSPTPTLSPTPAPTTPTEAPTSTEAPAPAPTSTEAPTVPWAPAPADTAVPTATPTPTATTVPTSTPTATAVPSETATATAGHRPTTPEARTGAPTATSEATPTPAPAGTAVIPATGPGSGGSGGTPLLAWLIPAVLGAAGLAVLAALYLYIRRRR